MIFTSRSPLLRRCAGLIISTALAALVVACGSSSNVVAVSESGYLPDAEAQGACYNSDASPNGVADTFTIDDPLTSESTGWFTLERLSVDPGADSPTWVPATVSLGESYRKGSSDLAGDRQQTALIHEDLAQRIDVELAHNSKVFVGLRTVGTTTRVREAAALRADGGALLIGDCVSDQSKSLFAEADANSREARLTAAMKEAKVADPAPPAVAWMSRSPGERQVSDADFPAEIRKDVSVIKVLITYDDSLNDSGYSVCLRTSFALGECAALTKDVGSPVLLAAFQTEQGEGDPAEIVLTEATRVGDERTWTVIGYLDFRNGGKVSIAGSVANRDLSAVEAVSGVAPPEQLDSFDQTSEDQGPIDNLPEGSTAETAPPASRPEG